MIPPAATVAIVEHELRGARAWADRHSAALEWLHAELELRVTLTQPETNICFYLRARLGDYRELPPIWTFCDAAWTREGALSLFPKPATTPHGASIFIRHLEHGVICAPFNRLAFGDHAGPHGDWGGSVQWLSAGGAHVRAETLGDMLAVVHRDLRPTRGRMADG